MNIFFTTKDDGNLAFHVNDAKENVIANHQKLAKKLNYNLDKLVHMKQIHSDIVHIVNAGDNFLNPPTCDALVTNIKNIPLMVMVADCTPVIFYDAKRGVIAVAHAGRQGAFKNIVQNTIISMQQNFDCDAKDIKIEIGVSISQECYEVGDEIYNEAKKLNLDYAIDIKDKKYFLDVNKILLSQLKKLSIIKENINILSGCTFCDNNKYYSYRKESQTGRFAGVIVI